MEDAHGNKAPKGLLEWNGLKEELQALCPLASGVLIGWIAGSIGWGAAVGAVFWTYGRYLFVVGHYASWSTLDNEAKRSVGAYFSGGRGLIRLSILYGKRITPFLLVTLVGLHLIIAPGDVGQRLWRAASLLPEFLVSALFLPFGAILLLWIRFALNRTTLLEYLIRSRVLRLSEIREKIRQSS